MKDQNDSVSQEKCGEFADREVIFSVTAWINALSPEKRDEEGIPFHAQPSFEEKVEALADELEGEGLQEVLDDFGVARLDGLEEPDLDRLLSEWGVELEGQAIFEYWAVSSYLAGELAERGKTVFELFGDNIWGRTASGQAIKRDEVIQDIVRRMSA